MRDNCILRQAERLICEYRGCLIKASSRKAKLSGKNGQNDIGKDGDDLLDIVRINNDVIGLTGENGCGKITGLYPTMSVLNGHTPDVGGCLHVRAINHVKKKLIIRPWWDKVGGYPRDVDGLYVLVAVEGIVVNYIDNFSHLCFDVEGDLRCTIRGWLDVDIQKLIYMTREGGENQEWMRNPTTTEADGSQSPCIMIPYGFMEHSIEKLVMVAAERGKNAINSDGNPEPYSGKELADTAAIAMKTICEYKERKLAEKKMVELVTS